MVIRFKARWFETIDRQRNQKADELSKAILGEQIYGVWLEPLTRKNIQGDMLCIEAKNSWMAPLKQYLLNGSLLEDPIATRKIHNIAARYVIVEGELYHTMDEWLLLKCVSQENGSYILNEVHLGICGAHIGVNAKVKTIMQYRYC